MEITHLLGSVPASGVGGARSTQYHRRAEQDRTIRTQVTSSGVV
jgi:hypothetical protein